MITGVIKYIDKKYFEDSIFYGLKDICILLVGMGNMAVTKESLLLCN
jgi:hypothetical protein